jgi:large subunit ribosomal protein L25
MSTIETADIVITVERRPDSGKEIAKRLRREDKIPAVVCGGGKPTAAISVDQDSVKQILKQQGGENTIFLLKLAGTKEERRAMIKDKQVDPITGEILHLDFIRVMRGHKLTVTIPIDLVGDSAGVRHGGRIDFISRDLQVEVLPREMFNNIELDISDLEIGDNITVADLEDRLPASGKFLEDPGRVVVLIEAPRISVEEEEEEEGELVVAEQAEPELIKKSKDDEDEGE